MGQYCVYGCVLHNTPLSKSRNHYLRVCVGLLTVWVQLQYFNGFKIWPYIAASDCDVLFLSRQWSLANHCSLTFLWHGVHSLKLRGLNKQPLIMQDFFFCVGLVVSWGKYLFMPQIFWSGSGTDCPTSLQVVKLGAHLRKKLMFPS